MLGNSLSAHSCKARLCVKKVAEARRTVRGALQVTVGRSCKAWLYVKKVAEARLTERARRPWARMAATKRATSSSGVPALAAATACRRLAAPSMPSGGASSACDIVSFQHAAQRTLPLAAT